MDQALNSFFAQPLMKSSQLLSGKILASFQKQTQGLKWLSERCTSARQNQEQNPACHSSKPKVSTTILGSGVVHLYYFSLPSTVRCQVGRPLNTVALLHRMWLKLLLHLYPPQDSPDLAPGTVGRSQFLRREREGVWPCWQCSTPYGNGCLAQFSHPNL